MRRKRRAAVRSATAVLLLAGLLSAPDSAVMAQSTGGEGDLVAARVAELLEIVTATDAQSDAAAAALEAVQADTALSVSAREQVMHDFALQLRAEAESAAGRGALEALTAYQSRFLVQFEGRGPAIVPKWRVAGVARGTLTLWDRAAAAAGAQQQLAAGTMDLAGRIAKAERADDTAALAQAFAAAPPEQLRAQRGQLLAMVERNDALAPAAAEAALRLQDAELAAAVLASGDRRTATRLIAGIGEAMPAEKAFPILRDASRDEALASAAILEIGRSAAGTLTAARSFLLESLADPRTGASAAAALAALEGDDMVAEVAAELRASDDETLQSKAVLMLALDGSPRARESLRAFALRRDVSEQLRQDVLTWLREGTE